MVESIGVGVHSQGAPSRVHPPDDGARRLSALLPMPGQFGMPRATFHTVRSLDPSGDRNMEWRTLGERHQAIERFPEKGLFEDELPTAKRRHEPRRDKMFQGLADLLRANPARMNVAKAIQVKAKADHARSLGGELIKWIKAVDALSDKAPQCIGCGVINQRPGRYVASPVGYRDKSAFKQ